MYREFQNSQVPRCPEPLTKSSRLDRPRQPEKAQIAVDGADHRHRDLRIENTLTDENGDDMKLKKGAHVEVTIAAKDINRDNEDAHRLGVR
jgi:hypothetical protein